MSEVRIEYDLDRDIARVILPEGTVEFLGEELAQITSAIELVSTAESRVRHRGAA